MISRMTEDARLRSDLKELLVKRLRLRGVDPAAIGDDDPLVKGPLGLDSIDILDLALAVEDTYGLKIDDEQLGQHAFRSIATLAAFVRQSRGASEDREASLP